MKHGFFLQYKSLFVRNLIVFLQALLWSAIVLSSVFNVSCSVTAEGIEIITGDFESPKLLSVTNTSEDCIEVVFSEAVTFVGASLSEDVDFTESESGDYNPSIFEVSEAVGVIGLNAVMDNSGKKLIYNLVEPTEIGKKYILFGEVKDKYSNTLTFTYPISGFNSNVATVVLSEIQDGTYSQTKGEYPGKRYEYVELYVLEPGNLAGIEIRSANDGSDYDVKLPAAEVEPGDFVLVHMRSDGDLCINECGADINLSKAPGSSDNVRDIWVENSKARFGTNQDVITLYDGNSNTVMDAILYSRNSLTEWKNTDLQNAATFAFESGAWIEGASIDNVYFLATSGAYECFGRTNLDALYSLAESSLLNTPVEVQASDWQRIMPSAAGSNWVK